MARSVAHQVLEILDRIPDGEVLAISKIKELFGASERVARVVNHVLRGLLDADLVRQEAEGQVPRGTLSPAKNASGGRRPDAVPDEGPTESGDYTRVGDRHLFTWKDGGVDRAVVLSDDELREIIREYVDRAQGGLGHTMQQVAVKHRLTRRDFHRIKSIYGLTKQHEPFTRDDMAVREVDDLAQEQLALKRQQLAARVEREDLSQIRKLAGKWVALQEGVLDPFSELLQELVGRAPQVETPPAPSCDGGWILFYQGSDLHYGLRVDDRMTLDKQIYNRDIAAERWHHGLNVSLDHGMQAYGADQLDYVLLGVGGDISHVDNIHAMTSSMRHHQDMDGLPHTLVQDIVEKIYVRAVDSLLSRGVRVHLITIPGNHDELLSRAFMTALWAAYRGDARVSFGNMAASHAFHLYGETLLIGHHGHGERKASAFASTAAVWLRDHAKSARHRYALTGNLHHLHLKEEDGLLLLQQPSPAASDVYHTLNGYAKSRAATFGAYFSPEEGLLSLRYIGW